MPVLQRVSVSLKSILFATDFSSASDKAASYAKALAVNFRSAVEIVHVFDPSRVATYVESILGAPARERQRTMTESAERLQQDFVAAGIDTKTSLQEGHRPYVEVLKLAKQHETELIVAGTHSRWGLERLVIGSTAEDLIRNAECPVLTVGQSWLQPAFSRPLPGTKARSWPKSRLKGGCGQDCPPHVQWGRRFRLSIRAQPGRPSRCGAGCSTCGRLSIGLSSLRFLCALCVSALKGIPHAHEGLPHGRRPRGSGAPHHQGPPHPAAGRRRSLRSPGKHRPPRPCPAPRRTPLRRQKEIGPPIFPGRDLCPAHRTRAPRTDGRPPQRRRPFHLRSGRRRSRGAGRCRHP